MQQELIEMLEEIIQYVEVWNAHDQSVLDKAEALIEKAKNTAPAQEVVTGCVACAMRDKAICSAPDQTVAPEYIEWLKTKSRSAGVAGNEAWNAGVAWAKSQEVGLTDELEQLGHIANGIRICGVHDKRFVAQRIDDIIAALRAKGQ